MTFNIGDMVKRNNKNTTNQSDQQLYKDIIYTVVEILPAINRVRVRGKIKNLSNLSRETIWWVSEACLVHATYEEMQEGFKEL